MRNRRKFRIAMREAMVRFEVKEVVSGPISKSLPVMWRVGR